MSIETVCLSISLLAVVAIAALVLVIIKLQRDIAALEYIRHFPKGNPNPVIQFTVNAEVKFVNDAASLVLSTFAGEKVGDVPKVIRDTVLNVVELDKIREIDLKFSNRDIAFQFVPRVKEGFVYAYGSDITDRKTVERELLQQTWFDDVTGLPNRMLFRDHIELEITHAQSDERAVNLLILQLDDFKEINSAFGDDIGDTVLKTLTKRFKQALPANTSLGRVGDRQFGLIISHVNTPSEISHFLQEFIFAVDKPIVINDQNVITGMSVGIAIHPIDGDNERDLFQNAKTAVARASASMNKYEFFTLSMNEKLKNKRTIVGDLHRAIDNREFVVFYQPLIDIKSRTLVGAEALVRWNHPTKGFIPPGQFIEAAEETGMIVPIGDLILETVCQQLKIWREKGFPQIRIGINLAAIQFFQGDLITNIQTQIKRAAIEASQLDFEITEGVVIDDVESAIQTMSDLKDIGVSLSIDDFGTGYSSLTYLKQFPVDKLKIDRSFVIAIDSDQGKAMINGVILLGHSLNLKIVAEGVEEQEQLDFLIAAGCDQIQGYYFAKPSSKDNFEQYFTKEF